jgi:hypothetical protein
MADHTTKVRDVAWSELLPWLMLIRSVRIALMARVLLLGAAGLMATMLGWWVLGGMFGNSTDPVIREWMRTSDLGIWVDATESGLPNPWVNTTARSAEEVFESAAGTSLVRGPISVWLYFTRPFIMLFDGDLTATGFLFLMLCCVWQLLVWGLFGGAITRIAALKFTRDEAPGAFGALRHALVKFWSYSLPVLIAMAGTAVFALQLVVLGLMMRVDFLAFVAALAWPFVILLGLMMAILLLGVLFGWPLMWATVSVEGTDAFDALSRSYAYTYHRPWRLLWYVVFAGFLAVASMFVVKLFASSAVVLGNWSIAWGLEGDQDGTMERVVAPRKEESAAVVPPLVAEPAPPAADGQAVTEPPKTVTEPAPPQELNGLLSSTKTVIHFWKSLVAALVAGYQAGFMWVSAVGVYLLLRRDIDGVQMNEVYVDQDDEHGLPPLAEDATTGVPAVDPRGAAVPGDTRG